MPKETIALWQSTGKAGQAGTQAEANDKPYGIWWYVLLALAVMAVIESIFAGKYMNPEQESQSQRKQAA